MSKQNNNGAPCSMCAGSGGVNMGGSAQTCPGCDGTGQAYVPGLFFSYPINLNPTPSAGAGQVGPTLAGTINILNAPFKWIFAVAVSTGAFLVQISDAKNQRQFFNQALPGSLCFGTATNPFPILNPWTFDQNGSILINVNDYSGAANNIWLGFIGVQLSNS